MSDDSSIELDGVVVDHTRGDMYRVEAKTGALRRTVLCRRSGKMIRNGIRIVIGDNVKIEVSGYDTTRGRITYRL